MKAFKSKFNYLIFLVRAILFVALIVSFILFVVIGIPSFWRKYSEVQAAGLTLLGFLYIFYIVYMFGHPFLTQRFNLFIVDDKVFIKDFIFNRLLPIDSSFKGYTISDYGSNRALFKYETLLFYFAEGHVVEFPQFLYWNFKNIKKSLEENNITYLGYEPFLWKNLVSRKYKFKETKKNYR